MRLQHTHTLKWHVAGGATQHSLYLQLFQDVKQCFLT